VINLRPLNCVLGGRRKDCHQSYLLWRRTGLFLALVRRQVFEVAPLLGEWRLLSSTSDPNSCLAQYTVRMKKHHKITASERDQIAWWLACGITIREMARRLGRSPSSISEELKRNKVDGVYGSIKAHQAAEARKRNSHQKYLLRRRPTLRDFVLEKLKLGWSPQQISGRLKKEINEGVRQKREYINHESIYRFL
jgi:DNA-binding CsgD family transcriptional regulator